MAMRAKLGMVIAIFILMVLTLLWNKAFSDGG